MDKIKLLIAVFSEKVPQEVLEGYVQNVDNALMKLPERNRSVLIKRFSGLNDSMGSLLSKEGGRKKGAPFGALN